MLTRKRKILFVGIFFLLISNVSTFSESNKQNMNVFKGKVVEISQKQIIVDRTHIALPKEVKIFDAQGNPTHIRSVKKGEYVIVEVDKNKAVIKISVGVEKSFDERSAPR